MSPSARPRGASHFFAGATSGFVTTILLQPLDVAKTRMQMSMAFSRTVGIDTKLKNAPNSGMNATLKAVLKLEGVRGLWRGLVPSLMRNMFGAGLYFVTLSNLKSLLRSADGTLSVGSTLLAGASARSLSACILCPLSVTKTRFEAMELGGKYNSVFNALVTIARKEGMAGLFAGLLPTIVRDAPYSALYLQVYEKSKEVIGTWVSPEGLPLQGEHEVQGRSFFFIIG